MLQLQKLIRSFLQTSIFSCTCKNRVYEPYEAYLKQLNLNEMSEYSQLNICMRYKLKRANWLEMLAKYLNPHFFYCNLIFLITFKFHFSIASFNAFLIAYSTFHCKSSVGNELNKQHTLSLATLVSVVTAESINSQRCSLYAGSPTILWTA